MKFTLSYSKALLGNDIDVQVGAEDQEEISRVTIVLDGFELSDEVLQAPCVSYQRSYLQVGSANG
jgi:hypothetical protein